LGKKIKRGLLEGPFSSKWQKVWGGVEKLDGGVFLSWLLAGFFLPSDGRGAAGQWRGRWGAPEGIAGYLELV